MIRSTHRSIKSDIGTRLSTQAFISHSTASTNLIHQFNYQQNNTKPQNALSCRLPHSNPNSQLLTHFTTKTLEENSLCNQISTSNQISAKNLLQIYSPQRINQLQSSQKRSELLSNLQFNRLQSKQIQHIRNSLGKKAGKIHKNIIWQEIQQQKMIQPVKRLTQNIKFIERHQSFVQGIKKIDKKNLKCCFCQGQQSYRHEKTSSCRQKLVDIQNLAKKRDERNLEKSQKTRNLKQNSKIQTKQQQQFIIRQSFYCKNSSEVKKHKQKLQYFLEDQTPVFQKRQFSPDKIRNVMWEQRRIAQEFPKSVLIEPNIKEYLKTLFQVLDLNKKGLLSKQNIKFEELTPTLRYLFGTIFSKIRYQNTTYSLELFLADCELIIISLEKKDIQNVISHINQISTKNGIRKQKTDRTNEFNYKYSQSIVMDGLNKDVLLSQDRNNYRGFFKTDSKKNQFQRQLQKLPQELEQYSRQTLFRKKNIGLDTQTINKQLLANKSNVNIPSYSSLKRVQNSYNQIQQSKIKNRQFQNLNLLPKMNSSVIRRLKIENEKQNGESKTKMLICNSQIQKIRQ